MKKKTLLFILGGALLSGITYLIYTYNKIFEIEDDTLEDDTNDLDIIFEEDFDINGTDDDNKIIEFDKINTDIVFNENDKKLEQEESKSILDDLDLEESALDYDSTYFELVCNVSRDEAIQFILKENNTYTLEQLIVMPNSELADIYSAILNNG